MESNDTNQLLVSESPIPYIDQIIIIDLWLFGISVSLLGLLLQLFIMVLIPAVRKYDEKLVTHWALVSCMYTITEYWASRAKDKTTAELYIGVFFLYFGDSSLACWLFIFTKNLCDKVVTFPTPSHPGWTKVYSFGVAMPVLVALMSLTTALGSDLRYFDAFCVSYMLLKLALNVLGFIMFCIIIQKQIKMMRNQRKLETISGIADAKIIFKVVIVTFIMFCITCVHTLCNNIFESLSITDTDNFHIMYIFAVANSFQAVATTGIFFTLMKRNFDPDQSVLQEIVRKIKCTFSKLF